MKQDLTEVTNFFHPPVGDGSESKFGKDHKISGFRRYSNNIILYNSGQTIATSADPIVNVAS